MAGGAMNELSALSAFHHRYWWWMAAILATTIYALVQNYRGKPWAQESLKILLVLNTSVVGMLYFTGVLASGLDTWLNESLAVSRLLTQSMTFMFFLMALLWFLDAFLGRTPLRLPMRPLGRILVLAGICLAWLYPLYELPFGNRCPAVQMFGSSPVPLLLFTVSLLGGARPATWLGRLLLILGVVLSLDAGLAAGLAQGRWQDLVVVLASGIALAYAWKRRRMITLNPSH
jgi:hypothetical protein